MITNEHMKRKVRFTVKLTETEKATLLEVSQQLGIPPSDAIRRAIADYADHRLNPKAQ